MTLRTSPAPPPAREAVVGSIVKAGAKAFPDKAPARRPRTGRKYTANEALMTELEGMLISTTSPVTAPSSFFTSTRNSLLLCT
jgi:hypothetical protein